MSHRRCFLIGHHTYFMPHSTTIAQRVWTYWRTCILSYIVRRLISKKMFDFNLQFARNGADFTTELYRQLASQDTADNIFFSPFSVQLCVALAFAGASGETAEEIAEGLKFVSPVKLEVGSTFQYVLNKYKGSPLVKVANKVYVQEGHKIKTDYKTSTQKYGAEAESINFAANQAAADAINKWVSTKTNDKIQKLVSADSLGDLTRLVLLNAIHFKGDWAQKFNAEQTLEDIFWTGEETTVQATFMNQKAKFPFAYIEELNCNAIELPYKDSDLSMLVLLPNEREGLKELAAKLKDINLVDLADKMATEEVEVRLPKFKVEYEKELTETMKTLGVQKMFTADAEFGDMLESDEPLSVSNIFHKACIEVNEEGTEAAAATSMIMMTRCMLLPPQFYADHPFLYFIWNQKNILFAGAFVNPATAQ